MCITHVLNTFFPQIEAYYNAFSFFDLFFIWFFALWFRDVVFF